jgi:putative tricarboxylic transport membrane protein
MLLAAMIFWGVRPGPLLMQEQPDIFWGLVASMYVGNVVLLIMNLPLVGVFAQILRIPSYVLHPIILGVSIAGAYGVTGNLFSTGLLVGFGLLGFLMNKLRFPAPPLILGFVLGDAMERAVRQSLTMSQGDPTILVARPISAVLLGLALLILLTPFWRGFRSAKAKALAGDAA